MTETQAAMVWYLKRFKEPVSMYHLANWFNCSIDCVRKSMSPLAKDGVVKKQKILKLRPGFKNAAYMLYYEAVDKRPYIVSQFKYHDPFNLGAS